MSEEMALDLEIQGWLDADDNLHEETLRDKILENVSSHIKGKRRPNRF